MSEADELGAIVECFKYWRHYFDDVQEPVQVYTDHNNLKSIQTTEYPPAQCEAGPLGLVPWSIRLPDSSPVWEDESCGWAVTTARLFHCKCKRGSESTPSNTPTQRKLALAEGSGLAQATTGFARVGRECGAVGATTGYTLVTTGVPGRIALL